MVRGQRAARRAATASSRAQAEWDARWWSPIINAEHLAMREHAGIFDLSAFAIFDVCGAGRARRAAARGAGADGRAGRPGRLHAGAQPGRRLQVRPHDHAARRRGVPRRHRRRARHGRPQAVRRRACPHDGSATLVDVTTAWTTIGLWGPRARDILASVTSDDVSHEGFPFGRCRTIEIGSQLVLASRISYVGDLGWELYVPIEQGARLWDVLWEAGAPHSLTACGIGVYGTTGPAREGLPRLRRRARDRVQRRRGRHGAAEREGAGLRRQGGAPAPPRGGAGGDPLHADGRRPHLGRAASSATRSAASRSRCATARRSPTPRAAART